MTSKLVSYPYSSQESRRLNFIRKYAIDIDVEKRWSEWLEFGGEVIPSYSKADGIHG